MSTSKYFNQSYANTQVLYDNLVIEMIKDRGVDVFYIPQTPINYDNILGEGSQYVYTNDKKIEMYCMNYYGPWDNYNNMFSKFGVEFSDSVKFVVSRTRFQEEFEGIINLPREKDIIYFPLLKNFMQVTEVVYDSVSLPISKFYIYELKTSIWTYNGELFSNISNPEILSEISKFPVGSANTELIIPFDNLELEIERPVVIDDITETNPYQFD